MHWVLLTLDWQVSQSLLVQALLTPGGGHTPLQQGCLELGLQVCPSVTKAVLALPFYCLASMTLLLLPCPTLSRASLALPCPNLSRAFPALPCLCLAMLLPSTLSRPGALLSRALLVLPCPNLSRPFLDLPGHSRATPLPSTQSRHGALLNQPWHLAATALRDQ